MIVVQWGNTRARRLFTWALGLDSPTLGAIRVNAQPTLREAWTGRILVR